MTRPTTPSNLRTIPKKSFEFGLAQKNDITKHLGLTDLPYGCIQVLQEVLNKHIHALETLDDLQNKTTPSNVKAALEKLRKDIKPFIAVSKNSDNKLVVLSGLDSDSYNLLEPTLNKLNVDLEKRIGELNDKEFRVILNLELLRETCPRLRMIFNKYSSSEMKNNLNALYSFTHEALISADIKSPGDNNHLSRLKEYLCAELNEL